MSRHIAVVCPACGHGFVINGRGRCQCGVYLVVSWSGMERGKTILRPRGIVFGLNPDGETWREL